MRPSRRFMRGGRVLGLYLVSVVSNKLCLSDCFLPGIFPILPSTTRKINVNSSFFGPWAIVERKWPGNARIMTLKVRRANCRVYRWGSGNCRWIKKGCVGPHPVYELWCRRRDSNPHGSPRHPLKMVCLPNSTTSARAFISPWQAAFLLPGPARSSSSTTRSGRLCT